MYVPRATFLADLVTKTRSLMFRCAMRTNYMHTSPVLASKSPQGIPEFISIIDFFSTSVSTCFSHLVFSLGFHVEVTPGGGNKQEEWLEEGNKLVNIQSLFVLFFFSQQPFFSSRMAIK